MKRLSPLMTAAGINAVAANSAAVSAANRVIRQRHAVGLSVCSSVSCSPSLSITASAVYFTTRSHSPLLQQYTSGTSRNDTNASDTERYVYSMEDTATSVNYTVRTRCGRVFDTFVFRQLSEAAQDQKWMEAIQRSIKEDTEYIELLKEKGAMSSEFRKLMKAYGDGRDAESEAAFFTALKQRLVEDAELSLSLCALCDAFTRIRKNRDEHNARRVANNMGDRDDDPMVAYQRRQQQLGGGGRSSLF